LPTEEHRVVASFLIVENEPLVAAELEEAVTEIGHKVIGSARTFEQVLRIVENVRPEVALIDYRLGDVKDGVVVARSLRQMGVKIIYVTAFPDEVRLIDSAAEVVAKPLDYRMLLATVERVIGPAQDDGS
jgi:DNA-binding response OmpR family regulator